MNIENFPYTLLLCNSVHCLVLKFERLLFLHYIDFLREDLRYRVRVRAGT